MLSHPDTISIPVGITNSFQGVVALRGRYE